MDRLLAMTTFTKVVQCSSFTIAGTALGISRSLVSRHIAELEAGLGVRLLNRTSRSLSLTDAGRRHYDFCTRVLAEIRQEEKSIKNATEGVEGKISIIAPRWIGNLDIADALAKFCKLNPKITIQLAVGGVTTKTYDFLERGFDIAFFTKRIRDSLVKVKKIADIDFLLAASPEYLAERGHPKHPKDLKNHDCLMQTIEPIWRFNYGSQHVPLKVSSRFSADSYAALCTAAVAGLGVALLPKRLADSHLKSGDLIGLLEQYPIEARPLYAAFAPGEAAPINIRGLLNFLGDWFRDHPLSNPSTMNEAPTLSSEGRSIAPKRVKPSEPLSA